MKNNKVILEGLDCANCANKIEIYVKKIPGLSNVSVDFVNRKLSFDYDEDVNLVSTMENIKKYIKSIEPEVNVVEMKSNDVIRQEVKLEGLSCANCAIKIEKKITQIEGVKYASVNFVNQNMIVEINKNININQLNEKLFSISKTIEPDIRMKFPNNKENTLLANDVKNDDHESDEENDFSLNKQIFKLIVGGGLFAIGLIFKFESNIELAIFLLSYIIVGGDIVLKALKGIRSGQVFSENFLMSIATIGAFFIGEYPEGVAVMLFYLVGELFQDIAVDNSRRSIRKMMDIRPDYANIRINNEIVKVKPESVKIGDVIIVNPGEKVPLDGVVIEGSSMVDTAALTGESVPRELFVDDQAISGFINLNGLILIKVTKSFEDSTVSKILELVENASSRKAPTEKFISKFAAVYTPIVVFLALALAILPPLLMPNQSFNEWIYRALVFLVISCPCALVISIPLGFFGGIGGASRRGILIKGSNYLEALNNIEMVIFDKTGTLTKGIFTVTNINSEEGYNTENVLELAAYAENHSNHPIAKAILNKYSKTIDLDRISDYKEISGYGINLKIDNINVYVGNSKLMIKENIPFEEISANGSIVYVASDSKYIGYIVVSDEVKADSKQTIADLKKLGIMRTIMLTGDRKVVGEEIGNYLGLDEVYSELLPTDKITKFEEIEKQKTTKGNIVFVGDGINDAPVLARANIGIAMGGLGSDAAIEAADVVIMTDEPSKIITAIRVAKKTRKIVFQNIALAMVVKGIFLVLGSLGLATMWEAVFADTGVALLAVFNALRVMNTRDL